PQPRRIQQRQVGDRPRARVGPLQPVQLIGAEPRGAAAQVGRHRPQVADQFGVKVVSADKTAGYGITHTTSSYIVDANGLLKIRMHYGQKIDRIANDIRLVAKGRI
ncbi:MAG TPA: hypothetical protein PK801_16665, partial [Aggregatilineales bacterium]|nr:hypothetical protein [Aggregatilineales bacterium]